MQNSSSHKSEADECKSIKDMFNLKKTQQQAEVTTIYLKHWHVIFGI